MAESRLERWLQPRWALPIIALIAVLVVIASPEGWLGEGAGTLSTFGAGPNAARSIYLVLERLGWTVERRRAPFREPLDTSATYVILAPPHEPSATEVSALLNAVRHGATAIVTPRPGTPLDDSVGMHMTYLFSLYAADTAITPPRDSTTAAIQLAAENLRGFRSALEPMRASVTDTAPQYPFGVDTLVLVQVGNTLRPEIMERGFGRGRVLVLGDPWFLRNAEVRDTVSAILGVRIVERLQPGAKGVVVFDEYHQGYGMEGGMGSAVRYALSGTPPGRVALMLLASLIVLYLATAVRPIAPVAMRPIERRSPLEHVGALSRAYEQVRATRTVASRLVRGLRRRHPLGATGASTDDAYLDLLAARAPSARADVQVLRHALESHLTAAELVEAGGAIDHIERIIAQ